ncbi:MAG: LLM class flavin-dependent oxidoreductase [Thermomicrobiales bacterium]|nr:LLM class flavin-dependent oxidoreductase [Thermomicrobiales bacterium]
MPERSAAPLQVGFLIMPTESAAGGRPLRWTEILAMTRRAEEFGFGSVWIPDHLIIELTRPGSRAEGAWEAWSLVAALAAATERIEIGQLVTCTAFRNPALLAKMADTVDEISGGRLTLGVGAGWCKREFDAFGYPFDHRVSRFAEALQIISGLLRDGHMTFEGEYYQVRDCELRPRGPRPQGPPILVGTSSKGERMLRLAARYADIWNRDFDGVNPDVDPYSPEDLALSQTKVDAACADVDRDPATLARTCGVWVDLPIAPSRGWGALTGTPEEIAAGLRTYADAGYSQVQVWLNPGTIEGVEGFAPVLELLGRPQ